MKKTIYCILTVLNIISILFILQIELNLIPLISSPFNIDTTTKINSLISSISQGLVISTIFYLVVIFIPEYFKSRTIRKLIKPRLITITNMIQMSVEYLSYKYELPPQNISLNNHNIADFKKITKLQNQIMNFHYKVMTKETWVNQATGGSNELDHFMHEKDVVKSKIDEMLALPNIQYEEDELIECLANLRDAWFYNGVEAFKENGNTIVLNFDKGVYDYYKCYKILKKYIKPFSFEINSK